MKRVVIDTDAGVDDALALILALRSPELHVEAITTVSGNVHVDLCTENVLRVLDVVDPKHRPPVAKGEGEPLVKPLFTAPEVHGPDGLGGLHMLMDEAGVLKYARTSGETLPVPAVEMLPRIADEFPGEVTLIAVGPLTNIAKAILEHPKRMKGYPEIVCMGGAFEVYGNTTPVSEFNVYVDPHAAQLVIESGIPVTFVPLDVTESVCLMMDHVVKHIEPLDTRLSRFIMDLTRGYVQYHMETEGFMGCYLHDPVAVGYVIDRTLCHTHTAYVEVETNSPLTMGMTVSDLRPRPLTTAPPNAHVCTEADVERLLDLFMSRATG